MTDEERAKFDGLVEAEVEKLPFAIQLLLQETPLLVEDAPSSQLLEELGIEPSDSDSICGLYAGVGMTERSVSEPAEMPETVTIFRQGILALAQNHLDAGGGDLWNDHVAQEIRVTILHEIGHHFGLSEEDLDALGFG